MSKSWFKRSGSDTNRGSLASVATALGALILAVSLGAQSQPAPASAAPQPPSPSPPPSATRQLLDRAVAADANGQFDQAIDALYRLVLEYPAAPELPAARLRLATLLALTGALPAALLQCQALRDTTPADQPDRPAALGLATAIARRLRAEQGGQATLTVAVGSQSTATGMVPVQAHAYFSTVETVAPVGLASSDEPTTIVRDSVGAFILVDRSAKRVQRISGNSAAIVPGVTEPDAAAVLPDGSLVIANKSGLVTAGKVAPLTGTWGGKSHPLRKIRALAANSRGDLLVIDGDYEGLLRCPAGGAVCGAWGTLGKLRTVKVGPSDFVYVLPDKPTTVMVVDDRGQRVAVFGPILGGLALEKITDIAVDAAHTLYFVDAELHRLQIGALRLEGDGRFTAQSIAGMMVPPEGGAAMRNPTALGVGMDGSVLLAGRDTARLLRFR